MKAYLTIDVGTSACKASLFDETGRLLADHTAAYPVHSPRPSWVEQNPQDWWQAAQTACRILSLTNPGLQIRALCICGQTPSCLPLDENGIPLRPAILWLDRRAEPQAAWLRKLDLLQPEQVSHNRLDSYFGGVKWLWLRQQEPELYRRTWKLVQANGYIQYQLCGKTAIDPSQAGLCSPCFDPSRLAWHPQICQAMDLSFDVLPEIRPSSVMIGEVTPGAAALTGLPPGLPIVCGGGDFACACLGAGVVQTGQAALMLGTAGNLLLPAQPNHDDRLLHTLHLTGQPLSFGGVLAGAALSWAKDLLDPKDRLSYADLEAQAVSLAPGAQGLLFLPYLVGERTPIWDPQARGAFVGLSTAHQAGHLVRAVMEGVAFGFRQILDIFLAQNARIDQLILLDGGARSPLWRQIFADILDLPVVWKAGKSGTALGAAFLAALAVGDQPSWEAVAGWTGEGEILYPQPASQKKYDALYRTYLRLYPHLMRDFHDLNALSSV